MLTPIGNDSFQLILAPFPHRSGVNASRQTNFGAFFDNFLSSAYRNIFYYFSWI